MLAILIICLVIFGAISLPIGIAMGLATMLCLVFATNIDPIMVAQNAFAGIDSFSLMAIPFFMLAGNFMRYGGISKRLLDLADNIVGFFTGGLGAITTFTAMFYAAISGSGPATVSAIGSFMIPEMEEKGYDKGYATALSAAAGTIGVIIPPSIPFVIYGVATGTSIGDMFKAGVIPGLLMGLALMLYNWATSKKYGWKGNGRRFNFKALGKSFIDSFWAILSPVIILGGIYGGFFTPTEAAAVSCVYTFIIGTFVYKEIHWKEFVDCMKDTVVIAGATSFIVGMSTSFAYVMTLEQVPETLSAFILGISDNKIIILLLMNVFLLVVGMFMDNISSCTILAPILLPVAVALGVNPVHFGIVMTMNLAIGFITPPYGVNLFVGSSVAHIPFERIVKWIWPFIGVIIVVLLLTTYIPQLSLLLMNVFLLVVGMFMDNISSCTILAPILLPVAVALGVNPVHFGIVMTMNLAIGFITPPYGVNLFVGSSVAHIPFERIVKWIWPFIGVIIVVLLLTTYIPQLSLLLV